MDNLTNYLKGSVGYGCQVGLIAAGVMLSGRFITKVSQLSYGSVLATVGGFTVSSFAKSFFKNSLKNDLLDSVAGIVLSIAVSKFWIGRNLSILWNAALPTISVICMNILLKTRDFIVNQAVDQAVHIFRTDDDYNHSFEIDKKVDEKVGEVVKEEINKKADEEFIKYINKLVDKKINKEVKNQFDRCYSVEEEFKKEIFDEVDKRMNSVIHEQLPPTVNKVVAEVRKVVDQEVKQAVRDEVHNVVLPLNSISNLSKTI